MAITREYFTKIEFVKVVEKMQEFEDIDESIIKFSEAQKPRIKELKNKFQEYRNKKGIK